MKTRKFLLSLLATSLLSTGAMANEKTISLSSQPIPLTTAVSDEFYQFSASIPAPDLEAYFDNIPQSNAEWRTFANKKDASAVQTAKHLAQQFGNTVVEDEIAGVSVYWVTPKVIDGAMKDKLFVFNQGGAFMLNSGLASTIEANIVAHFLQMPVLAIDYTKSYEKPAPAGRNDIVDVWKTLLETRSAASMVMGGSSGGATLTLLAQQELVRQGLPTASALYLGTPSADMTMTGDSRFYNEGLDHVLVSWRGMTGAMVEVYTGDLALTDPTVSPIYGSFENLPPSYLISGTRDLLLSDSIRLDRELKRAGIDTELNIYEGQSHGDYMLALGTPESTEHYLALNRFMREQLGL